MQPARVMLAIPFYQALEPIPVAKWEHPCAPGSPHRFMKAFDGSSCLTDNFNRLLSAAINAYRENPEEGPTHVGMVHADVAPDGFWLDDMLRLQHESGADLLSVVLPIKAEEGYTSTAVEDEVGFLRRLTKREARRCPPVFDAESAGFPGHRLMISTGLWLMDLRKPWVERAWPREYTPGYEAPCFTVPNRMLQHPDGSWYSVWLSEDWNFSRMLHKLGARPMSTNAIPCGHWGTCEWRNDDDRGYASADPGHDYGWTEAGWESAEGCVEVEEVQT